MTQDHKAKIWALADGFMPIRFEIRQRLRDGSLDFWATTGDYAPADVLEGLRAVKAGYGGPRQDEEDRRPCAESGRDQDPGHHSPA